jgi:hypothetical protein
MFNPHQVRIAANRQDRCRHAVEKGYGWAGGRKVCYVTGNNDYIRMMRFNLMSYYSKSVRFSMDIGNSVNQHIFTSGDQ